MGVKFNPFTGNLDLIDTTAAAGADTQVQFNNGGSLSGSIDFTWNATTGLTLGRKLLVNEVSGFIGNLFDFQVAGSSKLALTASDYLRLGSGTGGIQFNGDTAAANALDDYEEGTWTPVHSNAANTTATLTGLYRKIGNLVYLRISATGTGTLKVGSVSGLPFTNIATIVGRGGKVNHSNSATSDTSVIGYQANAAVINLNLSADVSVSVGASWVASITSVTF